MTAFVLLVVALGLILANGFFVAVEFSLLAARRGLIEEQAEQGSNGARRALEGMRQLNRQLAASQLGISIVSLLLGWLIEPVVADGLADLFGHSALPAGASRVIGLALGLVIVALIHMVMGEMVPKSLALASPERVLTALAPIHRLVVFVVGPIVAALFWMARLLTRLVGVEPTDELAQAHTTAELALMVGESRDGGELAESEHELLVGAIAFLGVKVEHVMAPRSELVTVPNTATVAEAEELVYRSGHSRVLVLAGNDEVTGFLHAKDLISLPSEQREGFLPPGIVRIALRVRADEALEDVLPRMRRARRHVAVVVDGDELVGLVTLEDILEAIVGDIRDESDGGHAEEP